MKTTHAVAGEPAADGGNSTAAMRLFLGCACVAAACAGAPAAVGDNAEAGSSSSAEVGSSAAGSSASAVGPGSTGSSTGTGDGESATSSSGSESSGEPVAACPADDPFPAPDWPHGAPEEFGVDAAVLEAAAAYTAQHDPRCLLVIRDGHLLYENYWGDNDASSLVKTYSIAKSYTSSLVGIALAEGILGSVDDPLGDYLPELVGTPRQAVRLRSLLTMTSGIYGGVLEDYVLLNFAGDQTQFALDAEQGEPEGAAWQYSNVGVQLLEPILRRATGLDVDAYARSRLWDPLSIDAQWDTDGSGHVLTYQNVRGTCRDHAKFGYLYLKRGCWDGERILDEAWVDAATATSQDLNRGYGYLFWVTGQEPTYSSVTFDEIEGGLHPFAPEGTFAARGLGGQLIEVIPELDMVIVRSGVAPMDDPQAWTDPLALIDELINGSGEDAAGNTVEMILGGVTP